MSAFQVALVSAAAAELSRLRKAENKNGIFAAQNQWWSCYQILGSTGNHFGSGTCQRVALQAHQKGRPD